MSKEVADILIGGVTAGAIYALVGIGFVVLYRSTGVMSFAQGNFMLLGALLFYTFTATLQLQLYVALLCSMAALGLIGAATYVLIFRRVAGTAPFILSVATIALASVIGTVTSLIWGPSALELPNLLSFAPIRLPANFTVTTVDIFSVVLAAVVTLLLVVGLRTTRTGLHMRAVADAPAVSTYLGIDIHRISGLAWGLAAAAAAAAGIVYSLNVEVDPSAIPQLGLLAFPAVLLGGLDSIGGALVGGLALAIGQSFVTTVLGGAWQDVTGYGLLLVVLLVRPSGIFGTRAVVRA